MATKRELELEIALWNERINSCRNGLVAVQAQAESFNLQSREAHANVQRLTDELKSMEPAKNDSGTPAPAPEAPAS